MCVSVCLCVCVCLCFSARARACIFLGKEGGVCHLGATHEALTVLISTVLTLVFRRILSSASSSSDPISVVDFIFFFLLLSNNFSPLTLLGSLYRAVLASSGRPLSASVVTSCGFSLLVLAKASSSVTSSRAERARGGTTGGRLTSESVTWLFDSLIVTTFWRCPWLMCLAVTRWYVCLCLNSSRT